MKRLVIIPIVMIVGMMPGYSQVDTTKGILFEHGLTWQEVLQKAKKENKYVFVDCYASWCGPCKWMDKNVYPVDSVGRIINEQFISVRMQMDSTRQDNEEIQQWYTTARFLEKKYHIGAYPSYLFFSLDGEAVHQDIGEKNISDFLSMSMAALNPQQQYYTLLDRYRKGDKNYSQMPVLARAARRMGQDSLSKDVARDYMDHYLQTLSAEELWTKENTLFVCRNAEFFGINDKIFHLFYSNRRKIDSLQIGGNFSDGFINYMLFRDEVKPMIDKALKMAAEPNWRHLEKSISNYYEMSYAKKNMLRGRIEYYRDIRKWKKYIKYFIKEQEIDDIEGWKPEGGRTVDLNDDAYEVFKYATNKRELEKALSWINRALTNVALTNAEFFDTKANLLYKLGKRSEGLALEEKSHAMAPTLEDITANYEKMKSGLPTWRTGK